MKITIKTDRVRKYRELKIGDVFEYNGFAYMLTNQIEEDTDDELKSVNLETGSMEVFGLEVNVRRFANANLILE